MLDRAEMEDVYRQHSFAVFRRCRHLLDDEPEAHDMTHEVFLRYFERPEAFQRQSSLGTYLYASATHLCWNRLRNVRARGEAWQQHLEEHVTAAQTSSPLESRLRARDLMCGLLAEADETTAIIALYHFVDGLAQGEVAKMVGLSRVSVNQKLQRFRAQVRAAVGSPT